MAPAIILGVLMIDSPVPSPATSRPCPPVIASTATTRAIASGNAAEHGLAEAEADLIAAQELEGVGESTSRAGFAALPAFAGRPVAPSS
jgi:hypothetical protein